MNIEKCPKCGYSLISEEFETHICKEILDYKIIGDMVYFFDGDNWYPVVKLSRPQPKGNTEKKDRQGNRI